MGVRAVLYEVEWQVLRVSMLAENSSKGGWTTTAGVADNLVKLDKYLNKASWGSRAEYDRRLYRIRNALTAVAMGQRGQDAAQELRQLVEQVRDTLPRYIEVTVPPDHWTEVYYGLYKLARYEVDKFNMVRRDLQRRARGIPESRRPELFAFLQMMEEVRLS